jgi:cytochrome c5
MPCMSTRTTLSIATVLATFAAALAVAGPAQAAGKLRIVGKPATKEQAAAAVARGRCLRGEFCGWRHAGFHGGLYHYGGTDMNLWNDRFENKDKNVRVANQISSLYNNGRDGAKDDVIAQTSMASQRWCIPNGYLEDFIGYYWNDTITGIRWGNCDGK